MHRRARPRQTGCPPRANSGRTGKFCALKPASRLPVAPTIGSAPARLHHHKISSAEWFRYPSRCSNAGLPLWQSWRSGASFCGMKRVLVCLALIVPSLPLWAGEGDAIATLRVGRYQCELPGNAMGAAGIRQPVSDFAITNSSSYATDNGGGSYLLQGDTVTLTSGPRRGERYRKISENFLRRLAPDGSDSTLRCVRNNSSVQ